MHTRCEASGTWSWPSRRPGAAGRRQPTCSTPGRSPRCSRTAAAEPAHAFARRRPIGHGRLMFLQLLANGLVTGAVYAIAAVGVSLVYGILRIVHFAYGDLMTFGAFVAVTVDTTLGLGMVVATAAAMVAAAALSVGLDFALWRPLRARRANFMSLFLASIGLALVLRQAIFLAWGPQPRAFDVDPFKVYTLGSVRLSAAQVIAVVVAVVAIVLVGLLLSSTSLGRTMRAVADDRALAAVAGIDTARVVIAAWVPSVLLEIG